jgi:hypothetical protein
MHFLFHIRLGLLKSLPAVDCLQARLRGLKTEFLGQMSKKKANIQVSPPRGAQLGVFPTKMPSTESICHHLKYPLLTFQRQGFLIWALFLRIGPQ